MPRVSKAVLDEKIQKELESSFALLISSLDSSSYVEGFFDDFLSEEENLVLTKRLMLHLMLENGYKQVEIARVLGMSRETIRVHSGIWKRGGARYKEILRKIAKKEKTKEFWKNVEKKLRPLDLFLRSQNDMKARAKFINRDYD